MKLNYVNDNREYQRILDRTYHGKVIPIERYINPKAVLLHSCLGCYNEFYARPEWLLTKESQKHDCNSSRYESIAYSQTIKAPVPKKKIPAEVLQEIFELHNQGVTQVEIAKRTGVNRKTIGKHIRQGY
ncbi:hypothetical protein [Peribacillus frigoritolerans]|uniref:hypothetical protein n=1 Tax=Peribacillus frigoritolerans TaxID=450367 RepID=UPI001F503E95|nr:hypothetical protein [Peribacillus frigoritolerans]MCK2018840.1 hypothetical protein [Peribacillus frigoritolerans]